VPLPADVRRALAAPSTTPSPEPTASPSAPGGAQSDPGPTAEDTARNAWPWALGGVLALGALLVLLRALRPR
jgi:hypothetical protein